MDKEKSTDEQTMQVDVDQLEKSWDDSVARLRTLLKGEEEPPNEKTSEEKKEALKKEKLEKAKAKKAAPASDEAEEEEDEEEEEEEMQYSKNLEDLIADEDSEAEVAMDVEPFLKALAKSIQKYIDVRTKKLEKAIGRIQALDEAQANALLKNMELQKATEGMVRKIGETPIPSGSRLMKGGEKDFGQQKQQKQYNRQQILAKSGELLRAGKIDLLTATKIEGRVNKNMALPDDIAPLFEEEKSA